MTKNSDTECDANSLVAAPVLIRHVGAQEWQSIYPEGVKSIDSVGGRGAFTKSSRNTLIRGTSSASVMVRPLSTSRKWRKRMVYKVGN